MYYKTRAMLFSSSSSSSSEFAPPSPFSLARSRQRRFPARDDRAPPAENDKHQMFLFPIARIHRVFPRVRHFRRGVRIRRVKALLLLDATLRDLLSSSSSHSYSSRERGRRESAQSRDAGHDLYSIRDLRAQTMTKKKEVSIRWSIFSNREIDTFRVVVVLRERC